jgi:hypothetical protein
MSNLIRVSTRTHLLLGELSRATGTPKGVLVDEAVELLRRQRWLEALNAGYTQPLPLSEQDALDAELALWDGTLRDGLEEQP